MKHTQMYAFSKARTVILQANISRECKDVTVVFRYPVRLFFHCLARCTSYTCQANSQSSLEGDMPPKLCKYIPRCERQSREGVPDSRRIPTQVRMVALFADGIFLTTVQIAYFT